ncbi:hypothetical protein JOC54_002932 [Alkalihalobacillus xiaoxiensis]|uniref:Uncharacterized protein n=1 Tax=Shouchella xiaoxiensis TaxID=766895 RepID=A0ABS2SZI8_9BACI|nr:hypothetical protein [Shouchella xiaoxiensis]MBM7839652.1 hypothetical protein [Shouchella xiaoxiensis]
MVRQLQIEVNTDETLSKRELAILQTLLLTIISASTTAGSGVMKPIPTSNASLSVLCEFHNELEPQLAKERAERIKRLLLNGFRMSGLVTPEVEIKAR